MMCQEHLSSESEQVHQFPIHYAYDYRTKRSSHLQPPLLRLNAQLQEGGFFANSSHNGTSTNMNTGHSAHSIGIFPAAAGLPWATGIQACRQNRYWQLSVDVTKHFLNHFAADSFGATISKSGRSLPNIARKELSSNVADSCVRFPVYLFPDANEQRTKLLAAVNVFIFLFDGKRASSDKAYLQLPARFLDQ